MEATGPSLHRSSSNMTDGSRNSRSSSASVESHSRLRSLNRIVAQKNRGSTCVQEIVSGKDRDSGAVGEVFIWFQGVLDDLEAHRLRDIQNNPWRSIAYRISSATSFQFLMGLIIIGHIVLGVFDTDWNAQNKTLPEWVSLVEVCIVLVYFAELFLRGFALRLAFMLDVWSILECFLVLCDFVMLVSTSYGGISLLRGVRLLRVFRLLRKFLVFREVYLMVQGVGSAFRTLGFGALIAFVIMTSLAVLAVETLNPLAQELKERGAWSDCEWCHRAFSSVMASNLTFVRTILAGDSWGKVCVPLIENYIEGAVILPVIFIIIQLGVVNIIIAVLVDRIQESRMDDEALRKAVKEESLRKSYRQLWKVFKSIDTSGDGEISIDELIDAYDTNHVFKNIMNMMDFTSENMSLFFDILDKDHSGLINYEEFVAQLHFMRVFDSHTILVVIHHLIECAREEINEIREETAKNRESAASWRYSIASPHEHEAESNNNAADLKEDQAQLKSYNADLKFAADVGCELPDNCKEMAVSGASQHQDLAPSFDNQKPDMTSHDSPRIAIVENCISMCDNLNMYDQMRKYIDALEIDTYRMMTTLESAAQELPPGECSSPSPPLENDVLPHAAPYDMKSRREQFKEKLKEELWQLKQTTPYEKPSTTSLLSWHHLRVETPLVPKATQSFNMSAISQARWTGSGGMRE